MLGVGQQGLGRRVPHPAVGVAEELGQGFHGHAVVEGGEGVDGRGPDFGLGGVACQVEDRLRLARQPVLALPERGQGRDPHLGKRLT